MKYYSDLLDKKYDTEEELVKAEEAYTKAQEEKEKAVSKKKDEIAAIKEAYADLKDTEVAAHKTYAEALKLASDAYSAAVKEANKEYAEAVEEKKQVYNDLKDAFIEKYGSYHMSFYKDSNNDPVVNITDTINSLNEGFSTSLSDLFSSVFNSWRF